jgi:acetylornithine deacetylase/succinyl-diaminopimelate desuccinylase-like protein
MQTDPSVVKELESAIDPEEILDLSKQMIRIPSQYTKEQRISKLILRTLDKWGFQTRQIPVKNHGSDVVADYGRGKGPTIAFSGHMDTVEVMAGWKHDPFGAKVEKGMLYGLGSLDMKCGLACMMIAFRTLADSGHVKGSRISFSAVSGEEDTAAGVRELISRGYFNKAGAVIVGEGLNGLGNITIGRRGGSYYDIEVIGKSAHGASPHLGINAIDDAARIVTALGKLELRKSPEITGDDFRPLGESQTVLRIAGGGTSLSVPEKCTIHMVRSVVPGGKVDISKEISALAKDLGLRSRVNVKFLKDPAYLHYPHMTSQDSVLIRTASKWVAHYAGKSPRLVVGNSEADDNMIAHFAKVPVICFGPGEGGKLFRYHQPEEAIGIAQLGPAARTYCMTALELSRTMSGK